MRGAYPRERQAGCRRLRGARPLVPARPEGDSRSTFSGVGHAPRRAKLGLGSAEAQEVAHRGAGSCPRIAVGGPGRSQAVVHQPVLSTRRLPRASQSLDGHFRRAALWTDAGRRSAAMARHDA